MKLAQKEERGVIILQLSGKIMGGPDASTINDLLHELIESNKPHVVVDMSQVEWMNSSGLGILIGGVTTLRNNGGDLKLACATKKIQDLLVITKLQSVFESFDQIEDAVASFQK